MLSCIESCCLDDSCVINIKKKEEEEKLSLLQKSI